MATAAVLLNTPGLTPVPQPTRRITVVAAQNRTIQARE